MFESGIVATAGAIYQVRADAHTIPARRARWSPTVVHVGFST